MSGWLKGLVAVTCVAVLAAVGWWFWSERQKALDSATAAQAAEWARQDELCDRLLSHMERDRASVAEAYGSIEAAERVLSECIVEKTMRTMGYGEE